MMRKMKDSGIKWIGEIPEEWDIGRIKYNFYLKGRIGWQGLKANEFIDDGPFLVTGTDFFAGRVNWSSCYHISEERYNEAPEIHVQIGDLLITKDGTVGKVAYIDEKPEKVSLNSHLLLMRPLSKKYNNKYLFWVIQSPVFDRYFFYSQNGTIMASLSQEKINDFSFAMPEIMEQNKICAYLDSKCSKIDSIISKQEQIIEKLKEYKLSLITEAVTKGLDSNVEMKDSGVEWIGKIPEKTTITRCGHLYKIILGKMLCSAPTDENDTLEKYYCAANVHFEGVNTLNMKEMWFSENEKNMYRVKKEDLLVVEGGAGAGGAAIVEESIENCFIQNSIMIARGRNYIDNRWLYYTLFSLVKRGYIGLACNKATIPHFTKEKLGNVPIVVFSYDEKKDIIKYLDKRIRVIDYSINNREQLITRYQEYKKSLIYEVVTGKKEV